MTTYCFSTEGLPYSLNRIDLIHMWVTLLEGCSFYDITLLLVEVGESQMRWETARRVGDLTASPWNYIYNLENELGSCWQV